MAADACFITMLQTNIKRNLKCCTLRNMKDRSCVHFTYLYYK